MKQDVNLSFVKGQKLTADVTVTMPPGPSPSGEQKVELRIPDKVEVDLGAPTVTVVHKFPDPLVLEVRDESKLHIEGGMFMYIVKDTQKPVAYAINPGVVKDAKGDIVPNAKVDIALVSDNPDAVAIVPDTNDQTKGVANFGNPGVANINCSVTLDDGTVLGSFGAQFTVTAGEPAAISGGTISFEGLTEAPEPPTP